MLIHVSGKLSDGRPVSVRVESTSAVDAIAEFAKKLPAGLTVVTIQAKPMAAANEVYIGTAKTPEEIQKSKDIRAANKAAKLAGTNGTAPAPIAATEPAPVAAQPTARSATARK